MVRVGLFVGLKLLMIQAFAALYSLVGRLRHWKGSVPQLSLKASNNVEKGVSEMRNGSFKLVVALCAFPLVLSLLFYPVLPETIPTHYWAVAPDSYGPKEWALVFPGLFCSGCNIVLSLLSAALEKGALPLKPGRTMRGSKRAVFGAIALIDAFCLVSLIAKTAV